MVQRFYEDMLASIQKDDKFFDLFPVIILSEQGSLHSDVFIYAHRLLSKALMAVTSFNLRLLQAI